jgi:hypothetical protein
MRLFNIFNTQCLGSIACAAALLIASEAGAAVLVPEHFDAGYFPISVAVADIDGTGILDSQSGGHASC